MRAICARVARTRLSSSGCVENQVASAWGRLFRNWESLTPDAHGFPQIGGDGAELKLTGGKALVRSLSILGTCITQAPEFLTRRARVARGGDRRVNAE